MQKLSWGMSVMVSHATDLRTRVVSHLQTEYVQKPGFPPLLLTQEAGKLHVPSSSWPFSVSAAEAKVSALGRAPCVLK